MKENEQQVMLSNELTNFLKTFKQTLSTKIHIFYSILTKADTINLIQKINTKQNQYVHSTPQSILITDETAKVIQRFCMRILEFLEYRICVLKSLKEQWLTTEINCFQGSLKKIFSQAKTFGKLDILIKKIIDCRNIFAKNVLTQIIRNKHIQGQQARQTKKLFQQNLLKSITLNQTHQSVSQSQFSSKTLWTSQRQNNPFQDRRITQTQHLKSFTENSSSTFVKTNAVSKIVSSIVQGQKSSKLKTRNRPKGLKLENLRAVPNVLSQNSLIRCCIITQPALNKKSSNQESSPKLPIIKQKKQSKIHINAVNKTTLSKQQYFDNIKKAMALEDTYWIVNSTYASLIKQLKELNRKNQATIIKFGAKCRKNASKNKALSLFIPETTLSKFSFREKTESPTVSNNSSRNLIHTRTNFNINTRANFNANAKVNLDVNINIPSKIRTNLFKTQTARGQLGFNHRIKTISSNQTRVQEVEIPKIQLSIPDDYTINQIHKRLYNAMS